MDNKSKGYERRAEDPSQQFLKAFQALKDNPEDPNFFSKIYQRVDMLIMLKKLDKETINLYQEFMAKGEDKEEGLKFLEIIISKLQK